MSLLLEVIDVSCGYGEKMVLKNINLSVNEGEVLGIIGPNGSGKTTLFRVITKILTPFYGKVRFEGKDLKSISRKELAKKVALVSQDSIFDLTMSVMDFVLLGRIPYRSTFKFFEDDEDMRIACDSLSQTGLLQLKDEPMSNLSGGERQLVSISKAIAQNPKLLLLDEPTSHLDIGHQVRILNLLRKLNKEKKVTEIVVFHDLNMASEFCDRLLLLSGGQIVIDGPPKQVLTFENVETVYETMVIVKENPISSKPYIFPVFEEWVKK
ncbi:MAG: ABC transporter ATP-binding protein [Deltaproteobacteria bacterium]|nr:ABC transporter ATP-binding protein [Deltaproteobacteria bacterium]